MFEYGTGNWSAYVPDLPGCVSVGDTLEETEANIREAIELHLEVMKDNGEKIPEPRSVAGRVSVAA
jgi:predicted RNase H-like HicB family nuclease